MNTTPESTHAETSAAPPAMAALVDSGRDWIRRAVGDYSAHDYDAAGAHGPLGLEHLGKAALWAVSPSLLVQLKSGGETSLVLLATGKPLSHPELRTIGLDDVLRRLVRVIDATCPVTESDRKQIVACRNGAMHLGAVGSNAARNMVTDVITLTDWLLTQLRLDRAEFYGDELGDADRLLRSYATGIEESVAAKIAAARRRHRELRTAVEDEEEWENFTTTRLAKAEARWAEMEADALLCLRSACPACQSTGALVCTPEVDVDADVETKHGETTVWPYFTVFAHPETFACGICPLRLWGPRELAAAGIEVAPREVAGRELGEFDPAHYLEMDGPRREAESELSRDIWDDYR